MPALKMDELLGRVMQVAYVVPDIHQAMKDFSSRLQIGPWFYFEHLPAINQVYRGAPVQLDLAVALGYGSGQMMFELIQQYDATPSVYQEAFERRGYGFHHFGIATRTFEQDVQRHRELGYELIFSAQTPRGNRGAYMDAPPILGGLIEYIEVTEASEEFYGRMHAASLTFTGSDPVRRLT